MILNNYSIKEQSYNILSKRLRNERVSKEEAMFLYKHTPVQILLEYAHKLRSQIISGNRVSWQIDRNINYTNVCISNCKFCNFHCRISDKNLSFTTKRDEYKVKIDELVQMGGDQILLQGGLHPKYDINFYEDLFKSLKEIHPKIKLNALGPPEIFHISKISKISIEETLTRLSKAGLTSLPGAGAEILSQRVRSFLSPGKPDSNAWIEVMKCAHKLNIPTTATMVYGHIETIDERLDHLITIRDIQDVKPKNSIGFRAFICWPMQLKGTLLQEKFQDYLNNSPDSIEHLKMIAISRIILDNIDHIQVSWLTIGTDLAKLALNCGADDMGSIMIEENVVSSAGVSFKMDPDRMKETILEAGFTPWLRNQDYSPVQ